MVALLIVLSIAFLVLVGLVVLAERSIRRQRGSLLRRNRDEQNAGSRMTVGQTRWPGSGGL